MKKFEEVAWKCPTCSFLCYFNPFTKFVVWFFGIDKEKFTAKNCPSTYCRGGRR